MKIESIFSFIRGLFSQEGEEARVGKDFLTVARNVDLSQTGRIKRRRGYVPWEDLQNSNSIPASFDSISIPEVANFLGFSKKIQKIDAFTDVDGNRYIIVVCDGKVYIETKNSEGKKEWRCLNPSGNIDIQEKVKPIDIAKFYGSLFFNDYANNVYVYSTLENVTGESDLITTKTAYFSGSRIWIRNYDYSAVRDSAVWVDSDASDDWITIPNDVRHLFVVGDIITVQGNGSANVNDGDYEIESGGIILASGNTRLKLSGNPITADNAGNNVGQLIWNKRIGVDGDTYTTTDNKEGKPIFDSLVDIGLCGTGNPIVDSADLNLSYALRTGNASDGFRYFVLSNANNELAANKCFIIEFDDRLIAQQFAEIPMDANANVLNFDVYDEFIYIWCNDGKISKLDPDDNFSDDPFLIYDVADLQAPLNASSKKEYSIAVNDTGMWVYTKKLAAKTDWWQPIPGKASSDNEGTLQNARSDFSNYYPLYIPDNANNWSEDFSPKNDLHWASDVLDPTPDGKAQFFTKLYKGDYYPSGGERHMFVYGTDIHPLGDLDHLVIPDFLSTIDDDLFITKKHGWSVEVTPPGSVYTYSLNQVEGYKISYFLDGGTGVLTEFTDHYTGKEVKIQRRTYQPGRAFPTTSLADQLILEVPRGLAMAKNLGAELEKKPYSEDVGGVKLERNNDECMLLIDDTHTNTDFFTDSQNSLYALLVCIEHTGANAGYMAKKANYGPLDPGADLVDWRWMLPVAKLADLNTMHAIQRNGTNIYFGASLQDNSVGEDDGGYSRLDLSDNSFYTDPAKFLVTTRLIPGTDNWVSLERDYYNNDIDAGFFSKYFGTSGSLPIQRFEDMYDFYETNSNVILYTQRQAIASTTKVIDQLRYLGTPKRPGVSLAPGTGTDLLADTTLRYYVAFVTLAGKTSQLSLQSDEIIIPNDNTALTIQSYNISENRISTNGSHLCVAGDVVRLSTTGDPLATPLIADKNYTVYNIIDSNTLRLTDPVTGGVLDLTADNGITGQTFLKINDQAVKIIVSGLNLFNASDVRIYEEDSISAIEVYRSQKNYQETAWSKPTKLAALTKDGSGNWVYGSFAPETYEDEAQAPALVSFPSDNLLKYPVYHILTHKNRMIMVGDDSGNNPNYIRFSGIDYAEDFSDLNIRDVQPADGDFLTAGLSVGDFLYLFKNNKIYAILGDVETGQFLDITTRMGCPYKNMITSYDNRAAYFLNEDGIYALVQNTLRNVSLGRLDNFFDPERPDCIDFSMVENCAFTYLDLKKAEIQWFVPRKENNISPSGNNCVIIYNIEYNYFRVYQYNHVITSKTVAHDVVSEARMVLMATCTGTIYKVTLDKNDAGQAIGWVIRTKAFNINSSLINKRYKLIKVFGQYMNNLRVTYWLDGIRSTGGVQQGVDFGGNGMSVLVTNHGIDSEIIIELSGQDLNDNPAEISEILLGFDILRGSLR